MGAERLTLNNRIFPQLSRASTVEEFTQGVEDLTNCIANKLSLLDLDTLKKIQEVFSNTLQRLQGSLRVLHEIEEHPYKRLGTQLLVSARIYGEKALTSRDEIYKFLEACNEIPLTKLATIKPPVILHDGTRAYEGINILDLEQPLPAGKYRFKNCEIYGSKQEKDRLNWSRVTHLTFVDHQGTNLRLTSANQLQILICENNSHLRTLNERVMVFEGLPALERIVLINNPTLEEHDLKCFFEALFISRASRGFSFQLSIINTPAFSRELVRHLCLSRLQIEAKEPTSSDEAKTYLMSYAPPDRSDDRAPASNPAPALPGSRPKSQALLYGVLAVCVTLGIFAPRFIHWALKRIRISHRFFFFGIK